VPAQEGTRANAGPPEPACLAESAPKTTAGPMWPGIDPVTTLRGLGGDENGGQDGKTRSVVITGGLPTVCATGRSPRR